MWKNDSKNGKSVWTGGRYACHSRVNVFPGQIEEVLFKIEEIGPHYEILVERKNRLDVMTITVELVDDRLLDSYGKLSDLEQRIKSVFEITVGLATQIRLVAPNSFRDLKEKQKSNRFTKGWTVKWEKSNYARQ